MSVIIIPWSAHWGAKTQTQSLDTAVVCCIPKPSLNAVKSSVWGERLGLALSGK